MKRYPRNISGDTFKVLPKEHLPVMRTGRMVPNSGLYSREGCQEAPSGAGGDGILLRLMTEIKITW